MGFLGEPVDVGEGFDGLVLCLILFAGHHLGNAHDDTAGVEVVVEGLGFAQELGAEQEIKLLHALLLVFEVEAAGVAHRDGALDDHHCVGIDLENRIDDSLHGRGVEEVLLGVVVGGGSDDHKLGIAIAGLLVEGGLKREGLVGQIILDVVVLDGRLFMVHQVDALGDDIDSGDIIMLCQQSGDTQTYITGSCNGYFHNFIC